MLAGTGADSLAFWSGATSLIAVPTGAKLLHWTDAFQAASLAGVHATSDPLISLFLALFQLGGASGVALGSAAVDVQLHDSYFVVSHFHFTLALGVLAAALQLALSTLLLIAGAAPLPLCGAALQAALASVLLGVVAGFCALHALAFSHQPRRSSDACDHSSILLSTASSLSLCSPALLVLVFQHLSSHLLL